MYLGLQIRPLNTAKASSGNEPILKVVFQQVDTELIYQRWGAMDDNTLKRCF